MKRIISMVFLLLFLLSGCSVQSEGPSAAPSTAPSDTTGPEKTEPPAVPTVSDEATPAPSAEVTPSAKQEEEKELSLFLPNDSVDGFVEVREKTKVEPQSVVDALISHGALPEGTKVLKFEIEEEGKHIVLDLSREFENALCSTGTSGEAMLTGSLVNTMLRCWDVDTLSFTCEGKVVESGHVVYDFPLSFRE